MKAAFTTVINLSGDRKYFSFLPAHGLWLEPFQWYTVRGELTDRMIPSWPFHSDPKRPPNKRKLDALKKAEQEGELQIVRDLPVPRYAPFRKLTYLGRFAQNPVS